MNNNELAAQCLIEAAELLGESAGRNGVAMRYRDAKLENIKKEIKELRLKDKLTNDEQERLDELLDAKSYVNSKSDYAQPTSKLYGDAARRNPRTREANIAMGKFAASASKTISDGNSDTEKPGNWSIKPSSYTSFYGIEKYDRSGKKINPIHNKINKKASINEAIEFAELEDYLSEE
jgi:hypothetical protein